MFMICSVVLNVCVPIPNLSKTIPYTHALYNETSTPAPNDDVLIQTVHPQTHPQTNNNFAPKNYEFLKINGKWIIRHKTEPEDIGNARMVVKWNSTYVNLIMDSR